MSSPPAPQKKLVCVRCNREFASGYALGGHMKAHYRKKPIRFTRRKRTRKATTTQEQRQQGGGDSRTDQNQVVNDRTQLSLPTWKVRRKRGSNAGAESDQRRTINCANCGYNDEEEEDLEDEEEGLAVMERLRKMHGITGNNIIAHRILEKKLYMCKPCGVHLRNFRAVVAHVKEYRNEEEQVVADVAEEALPAVQVDGAAADYLEEDGGGMGVELASVGGESAAAEAQTVQVDQVAEDEGLMEIEEVQGGMNNVAAVEDGGDEMVGVEEASRKVDDREDDDEKSAGSKDIEEVPVPPPNSPRLLDFDLNLMPPNED